MVLSDTETIAEGQKVADDLMKLLDIPAACLESGAYLDLLNIVNGASSNGQATNDVNLAAKCQSVGLVGDMLKAKSNEC